MQAKKTSEPKFVLEKLGEMSALFTKEVSDEEKVFERSLAIFLEALHFDFSVLYRVNNLVDDHLILEVVQIYNPNQVRRDLKKGTRLNLNINEIPEAFMNECHAFKSKGVSSLNVPGAGCDLVGYVDMAPTEAVGYLLGGDFLGQDAAVAEHETRGVEVICNLLSCLLMKTHYEHLAVYDSLTGLYNARAIRNELEICFKRFTRQNLNCITIVMADIDHFKKINDEYGHLQGDVVLEEMGQIISKFLRSDLDLAGRYGGEEFLIVLENTNLTKAKGAIERLRKNIEDHSFSRIDDSGMVNVKDHMNVTVSFGISTLELGQDVEGLKNFLAHADKQLYIAKESGRNRVQGSLFEA